MPFTDQERETVTDMLKGVEAQIQIIIRGRDKLTALMDMGVLLDNDTSEDKALVGVKLEMKTAAETMATLL